MKPTAVLINVARGACVVEEDLWVALKRRSIAGAIIDVWWGEHASVTSATSVERSGFVRHCDRFAVPDNACGRGMSRSKEGRGTS